MKNLKKIITGLVVIIAMPLLVALFVPNQYTVNVSIVVNQPKTKVFDYIKILENQKQYSEWLKADPNLNTTITGTDGTVGAKQKWNSKIDNVGEGEQTITALTEDRMDVDLKFIRPFAGESKAVYILKTISPNQTQLTNEFYSQAKYPFNLMSYFIGRPMIEKTQAQNMKNVKTILEKN
jgi:hypothetical protein